ncbi:MAG: hypothetical protein IJN74_03770 [Clostridia bacterium]|nr:hypothetical protein [Clostridia bacterium]
MNAVFLNTKRSGYSPDQCKNTMTVGELMNMLDDFDEDAPIYFKNDDGYTYGSITRYDFEESVVEEN